MRELEPRDLSLPPVPGPHHLEEDILRPPRGGLEPFGDEIFHLIPQEEELRIDVNQQLGHPPVGLEDFVDLDLPEGGDFRRQLPLDVQQFVVGQRERGAL
jgi:hypothetical protein